MNPCLFGSIKAGKVAVYHILLQSAFTCRQTFFNPSLSLCAGSTSQLLSNLVSGPKKWNSPPLFHQIDDRSPLSHQMVRGFHYGGFAWVDLWKILLFVYTCFRRHPGAETQKHTCQNPFRKQTFTQTHLALRFHLSVFSGWWWIKQSLMDVISGVPQGCWARPSFKGQQLC